MTGKLGPHAFSDVFDVSRETLGRLTTLAEAVARWNHTINLVAPSTVDDVWSRHIADCAQLWLLRGTGPATWLDLGSGGGFPGLVIAILAADNAEPMTVTLVESDRRKAAFLSTVSRDLNLPVRVRSERAEVLQIVPQDIVSARALAPLDRLLGLVARLRHPEGRGLLPKGRAHNKELDAACRLWKFDYKLHPSMTDPDAAIIEIGAIHARR